MQGRPLTARHMCGEPKDRRSLRTRPNNACHCEAVRTLPWQSPGHSGSQFRTCRGGHWPPVIWRGSWLLVFDLIRPAVTFPSQGNLIRLGSKWCSACRGRCPHRPETREFGTIKIKRTNRLTYTRVDVGIDPYTEILKLMILPPKGGEGLQFFFLCHPPRTWREMLCL